MTRKQMEAVIKDGGSVMVGGKIITKLDELPGEEDLATTDEEKAAVADNLRTRLGVLSARLSKIEGKPSDSEQMGELLTQLEADNAALNIRLADAHNQNEGLRDELTSAQDALIEAGGKYRINTDALKQRIAELEGQQVALQTEKTAQGTGQPVEGLQVPPGQSATLTMNPDGTGSAQLDSQTPTGTPLPADFPKRDELMRVGLATIEAVDSKSADELNAVEGLTLQTAKAVKGAAKTALGK